MKSGQKSVFGSHLKTLGTKGGVCFQEYKTVFIKISKCF